MDDQNTVYNGQTDNSISLTIFNSEYVCVHNDSGRKLLQPTYHCPYKVIKTNKDFPAQKIAKNTVAIDRLKLATVENNHTGEDPNTNLNTTKMNDQQQTYIIYTNKIWSESIISKTLQDLH